MSNKRSTSRFGALWRRFRRGMALPKRAPMSKESEEELEGCLSGCGALMIGLVILFMVLGWAWRACQ